MGQIDYIAQEIECALATDDVLAKPIQCLKKEKGESIVRFIVIGIARTVL